ncbi:MAG: DEAD/DEAH box helicase [Desulfobacterota bacterium]|jgi:ATP-dependent RNA helicase RhlE|nr:DEAD/DEAH box helicase [Thermodesulfobacteriota bacterium]
MTFEQFNLHADITAAVVEQGYTSPTPIQEQSIPHIMHGRDVLGLAQTGTGKTAAFVLPLLHGLMRGPRRRVRALILAPTRELAIQIHESLRALGQNTRFHSAVIIGGVSMDAQVNAIRRGAEIIVACPGRLLDHLSRKNIDLSTLETLVIDEADRMFDMGFLPDIRRIVRLLPGKRQNLLFSATMPDDIRRLSTEVLHDAVTVQINHTRPLETISHSLYSVEQHLKTALLKELLKCTKTDSVLVFTRTKHRAKKLAQQLDQSGFSAASLQGNLSQNQRQQAIEGFRDGSYKILVATDIAARGIDVSAITHVINYDMPDTADAYTHRIGRTGRVSRTGEAFTFVTSEDTSMAYTIECILGDALEHKTLPGFDYDRPRTVGPVQAMSPGRSRQHRTSPAAQPARERQQRPGDRYRIQVPSR